MDPFNNSAAMNLPENNLEYLIISIGVQADAKTIQSRLEVVRKAAIKLCGSLTAQYIWQREEFNLQLHHEKGEDPAFC
jgi:hypothetical protein